MHVSWTLYFEQLNSQAISVKFFQKPLIFACELKRSAGQLRNHMEKPNQEIRTDQEGSK